MRDVLLQLGARAYMTITPYGCGSIHSGEARSPRVELKFQLAEVLFGLGNSLCADQRERAGSPPRLPLLHRLLATRTRCGW